MWFWFMLLDGIVFIGVLAVADELNKIRKILERK